MKNDDGVLTFPLDIATSNAVKHLLSQQQAFNKTLHYLPIIHQKSKQRAAKRKASEFAQIKDDDKSKKFKRQNTHAY